MSKSFPNTGAITGTNADRLALSGVFEGMQFFETDTNKALIYDGSSWVEIADLDYSKNYYVFDTEANRDAAIGSPTEGMIAYLTAPTIPAATGNGTFVPTGVTTIYNGSVWVCVTEVGAKGLDGTLYTSSTSYTSTLTGDGTAVSVTLVTGTTALVSINARGYSGAQSVTAFVSVAVSGATTLASNNANGVMLQYPATNALFEKDASRSFILGGLTAGTNTFTMQAKTGTSTITLTNRHLVVKGIA